jgi:cytochrome c peroxidase
MFTEWTRATVVAVALCLLAVACGQEEGGPASGADKADDGVPLAPGYGPLGFEAPEPGTYDLPPLGDAADGRLLASDGSSTTLHEVLGGKVAILSLMYASCSDVNGCPLATAVLHQIASRMEKDEGLADGLRLLSLSFDPARDTPDVMGKYASHHVAHGVDWQFLTTASDAELVPILADYGQSLVPEFAEDGSDLGSISHILRVFLIDSDRRIRNIYSVSYLHADTLVADVKTLLMKPAESDVADHSQGAPPDSRGPGDFKEGYEHADYASRSLGLATRRGEPVDLIGRASSAQLGLPEMSIPSDNPLTREKVALGRKLFYDRRLSLNNTLSCAMCHVPEQGFANNELAMAVGIEGRTVRRNSPTILNAGYSRLLFHDGRENRLENQVWGPLLARNEMGNPSVGAVIERIREIGEYESLFEVAFPGRGLAIETIGMALASYERTLVSGDSSFDRWKYAEDETALGDEAIRGFRLFSGKAGCVGCHQVGPDFALFTDGDLHNTGIGYKASMIDDQGARSVQLAPGEYVSVESDLIAQVSETAPDDLGLYEITQDPIDRWKYKTPSLRNVALTAPYMHNGSLATLREVVEFYDRGGVPNDLLDRRIRRLDLSEEEMGQLVAYLESLTGGDVGRLVADGFAAQVGDLGESVRPE